MNIEQLKGFQKLLEEKLHEIGLETILVEGTEEQIGDTLRLLAPLSEAGDAAIMEVMLVPYTDEADLLILYSTLFQYAPEQREALMEKLLEWNLTCPLGAFGLYMEERHFYHKYSVLVPLGTTPPALAETAMELLDALYALISVQYEEAARLGGAEG